MSKRKFYFLFSERKRKSEREYRALDENWEGRGESYVRRNPHRTLPKDAWSREGKRLEKMAGLVFQLTWGDVAEGRLPSKRR